MLLWVMNMGFAGSDGDPWSVIDDSQTANWTPVVDTQTDSWTPVIDGQ